MAENGKNSNVPQRFESIPQNEVPRGRDGKHRQIVVELIDAIGELRKGAALKISLADLPDSKENIRAALSRATKQRQLNIATSSDEEHLYIWKIDG